MVRKPIAADRSYDGDFNNLQKQIHNCFEGELGPGATPVSARSGQVLGIVVPHDQYLYSGQCAAWAYKEVAEADLPDVYVILSADHTGAGSAIVSDDWETPFGVLKTDSTFARTLAKHAQAGSGIAINDSAHQNEHAIEVQLPFLQFTAGGQLKKIKVVGIQLSADVQPLAVAEDIKKTIAELGSNVCFIASSNLTHFGKEYGFVPFVYSIKENIQQLDKGALAAMEKLDAGAFLNYVKKSKTTIFGAGAIAAMLEVIWEDVLDAHRLCYYLSTDVIKTKDQTRIIGFGSMVFKG